MHSLTNRYRSSVRHQPASASWLHGPRAETSRPWQRNRCASMRCHATTGNHYDVLGIARTATVVEIKTAFRKLALKLHPDVNKEPAAGKQFVAVKEAYEILSDVQTRGQYDEKHRASSRVTSSGPGYASREVQYSWEPVQRQGSRNRKGNASNRSAFESVFGFGIGVDEDGGLYVEMDDEESVEDEVLDSFGAWANSGARKSSFQGSFEANAKKQKRKQEAAAAAAAQAAAAAAAASGPKRPKPRPASSSSSSSSAKSKDVEPGMHAIGVSLEELLHSMEPMVRRTAQKVYGRRLEDLTSAQELLDFYDTLEMLENGSGTGGFSEDPQPPRSNRGKASTSREQAPEWTAESWEAFVNDSGFASSSPSRSRSARKQAATAAGTGSPIGAQHASGNTTSSTSRSQASGRRAATGAPSSGRTAGKAGAGAASTRGGPVPNSSRPAVPSSRPGRAARGAVYDFGDGDEMDDSDDDVDDFSDGLSFSERELLFINIEGFEGTLEDLFSVGENPPAGRRKPGGGGGSKRRSGGRR